VFANPKQLADHLARLLSDPHEAKEMGLRGRSYVLDNYQWPHVLDLIEADLSSLERPR
jgi:spore maturation protein CgeB